MDSSKAVAVFESKQIRRHYDDKDDVWYFSLVDIVEALTESSNPTDYLKKLRKRDSELNSYIRTNCPQVAMLTNGKNRKTLAGNAQHIFRLIQSIPSLLSQLLSVTKMKKKFKFIIIIVITTSISGVELVAQTSDSVIYSNWSSSSPYLIGGMEEFDVHSFRLSDTDSVVTFYPFMDCYITSQSGTFRLDKQDSILTFSFERSKYDTLSKDYNNSKYHVRYEFDLVSSGLKPLTPEMRDYGKNYKVLDKIRYEEHTLRLHNIESGVNLTYYAENYIPSRALERLKRKLKKR